MAVPGSGSLSLLGIWTEKNESEYGDNQDGESTFSLRGLSNNSHNDSTNGNINLNVHSPNLPDTNTPHKMSEFYAYDHDFSPIACNLAMDVVFLIDYTASMSNDMNTLKSNVATITNKVVERSGGDYRLAAVLIDQDDNQPGYWTGNNTVVANLNSSYKYNSGNVYLAAMVPFAHSNKSDFDTKIGYLNGGSNSATSMELGYGEGNPEPNDTAIDRVINHDLAGAFRSGVNKMVILMTDHAPDGDGDDTFNGTEEYNKMGTLSGNAVANNITIMICGDISDSGTHPQSVHGIYQGYADNTGGSFNSNHNPSNITGFINTICNDIESLYPSAITNSETNVTNFNFTMNGNVANDSLNVTAKGFVRATTNVNLRKGISGVTDTGSLGSGTAAYSSTVTGVGAGSTHYYRAWATTSDGGGLTSYGDIETVTTNSATAPGIVSNLASSVSSSGMTMNGNMTSTGGATITDKGFVYSSSDSTPTIGEFNVTKLSQHPGTFNTTGSYSRAVTGLSSNTTYYYRAFATNSVGTSYGSTITQPTQTSYVTRYTSGPHQKSFFACYQTMNTVIRFTGTFGNGTRVYDNNLNVITNDGWYGGPPATSSGSSSSGFFYVSSTGYVSNYSSSGC